MTILEVLGGIEDALKENWTDAPVYRDRRPQNFQRLSFLLEAGPIVFQEAGGGETETKFKVRVTAFTPVDDYYNSSSDDLTEVLTGVMELFAGGYIRIGGRAPHVESVTGDYGFDYAEVTAQLVWYDTWLDGEEFPLMQEIRVDMNGKDT